MASQFSPRTPQSTATDSSTPSVPTKSSQSLTTSSILRMIEPILMVNSLSSPLGQRPLSQTGQPRGGRTTSPSRRSPLARATLPSRSPAVGGNMRFHVRTPGRPTTGVLSPRKAIGKRLVPLSSGGHMAQVAALQTVMPKSPEYSPASPSLPRTCMVGRRVSREKELRPPLDREERESIDSNSRSVR